MDDKTRELVNIAAAVTGHCQPCLKHHMAEAKRLGVEEKDIRVAIAIAESVSRSGDKHMLEFANTLVE